MDTEDLIKHRDIRFRGPHELANQAEVAAELLGELPGVLDARELSPFVVHVTYDIRKVDLRVLVRHLQIEGFHLDNALLEKLRLALIEYAEDAQRSSLGLQGCPLPNRANGPCGGSGRRHCAEEAHDHWRHYL